MGCEPGADPTEGGADLSEFHMYFDTGTGYLHFYDSNANPNRENVVVHYSPTINATDARGVADVLAADKARLIKLVKDMLADQRLRDEVEVYA